jgi:phosphomannomutase/phosphomannomutase/phosphoglucomutase
MVLAGNLPAGARRGGGERRDVSGDYVQHLLSYVDPARLRPFLVVSNPGNGGAGPILDLLEPHLPLRFAKLHHAPDGRFPNGIPNPLLPEKRAATADAVVSRKADLGIAWDGDFDRCFFFDEQGGFVEGYYIVGLLAERVLERHRGARIVHDPRLTWNTIEQVTAAGGIPVQSKSGHAFMKETMRRVDAVYGGELSAHHFFREFAYCDSGMIPWLLVVDRMSTTGKPLSELVGERMRRYPASGEINRRVEDQAAAMRRVLERYRSAALRVDETDGVGIDFERWRFNLRPSNTEPLIRLNVESRGDVALMKEKTQEVLDLLGGA